MENTCAKCHRLGFGCCFVKDSSKNIQIGIFYNDIQKIKDYLNVDEDYFIVRDVVSDNILESLLKSGLPYLENIFYKNTCFKLKTIEEKCIFYTATGCRLPNDIRPIYCRIYPFWPSMDSKNIYVLSSYDCLAQEKSTINWTIVNKHFNYS
jgi:Fe-S-cluster containining protein